MKDKIEYINFMMWLQSDTAHLNYDPVEASEKYLKFRDLEGKEETCQCSASACEQYSWSNLCYHCRKPLRTETIHSRYSPPEPEGVKEWKNLLALDMADFYLEIYASRDTFSRAKIMEMFRDYHNHKLSNIKKKITDKIELFENAIKASNELESNQIERYEAIIRNMNHLLD